MRKLFIAVFMFVSSFGSNVMADGHSIKMGIILGFTGPIESLTPAMAASAELAFKEASDSGSLLGGKKIEPVRADSTCVDSAAATAAAEGLISGGVAAIMGADCSGVTGAIATNVAVPNGVVMISPSATSPGLTTLDDKGYFFRTAPSDARGGQILADITKDRKVKSVAITYTNNDYGKGLADVYKAAVEAHGIKVTTVTAHEDGKADYSSEVATLASAGGDAVAVIGYLDQGGKGIIQASLDSGAFDRFILSDGMIGQSLVDAFGTDLSKSFGRKRPTFASLTSSGVVLTFGSTRLFILMFRRLMFNKRVYTFGHYTITRTDIKLSRNNSNCCDAPEDVIKP